MAKQWGGMTWFSEEEYVAIASNSKPIGRILDALGLEHVRSMTISAAVGSVVAVVTEQYVTGDQLERLAGELETKEWVLVPKAEWEAKTQHRCRWGDDESGPHFSNEYLESLERGLAFEEKAHSDGVIDLNLLYPPKTPEAK